MFCNVVPNTVKFRKARENSLQKPNRETLDDPQDDGKESRYVKDLHGSGKGVSDGRMELRFPQIVEVHAVEPDRDDIGRERRERCIEIEDGLVLECLVESRRELLNPLEQFRLELNSRTLRKVITKVASAGAVVHMIDGSNHGGGYVEHSNRGWVLVD